MKFNEGGRDEYAFKAGGILEKFSTYVLWIEALTSDYKTTLPQSTQQQYFEALDVESSFPTKKMANQL